MVNSKTELHKNFQKINQEQQANAFSSLMVEKVLGVQKPWKQLNKQELEQMLAAWEHILAKCPKTSDWKTVKVSDRLLSITANGQRWVDYFGFASWTPAQEFVQGILPDCEWALIRKSGKRLNVSIECKVWQLDPKTYQQLVETEKAQHIQPYHANFDLDNSDFALSEQYAILSSSLIQ
jgi:hypothetical protein